MIYCFGGEISLAAPASNFRVQTTPPESIWGFTPDGTGSGSWSEVLGPTGMKPFPSNIIRTAAGASATDNKQAYNLGGFASIGTSPEVDTPPGIARSISGLLTFTFEALDLRNSSYGGYYGSQYRGWTQNFLPGSMEDVPLFNTDGFLVIFGGGPTRPTNGSELSSASGFDNITIYDKRGHGWLYQTATGAIPQPRLDFCSVGVHSGDNNTFEM